MGNHGVLICITSKNLENKRNNSCDLTRNSDYVRKDNRWQRKKKNLSEFQQRSMHAPLVIFYGDSSAIEPQISALKTIHSCF